MPKKIFHPETLHFLNIGESTEFSYNMDYNDVTEIYTRVPGGYIRDRLQRNDYDRSNRDNDLSPVASVTSVFIPEAAEEGAAKNA